MAIAAKPSAVSMPMEADGCETVLDFLCQRFPRIEAQVWRERLQQGKVHREDGTRYQLGSPFVPQQKVLYYREVPDEPLIPVQEQILFQDELILIACKPHFLPVHPSGPWVNECLVNRLRKCTGNSELTPAHRIDRETAGLVLCCKQAKHRAAYQRLFATGDIQKSYRAVAAVTEGVVSGQQWVVRNRMVKGDHWMVMAIAEGEANSHSTIECLKIERGRGLFALSPHTGKTHQLRLHMNSLGMPLEYDRFYPQLLPKAADNYACPLQLLAYSLVFTDPVSNQLREFITPRRLNF
ncbi:MAG: pseudouridine synthase [Marinobacterium sp.]|nr:pseudouridine synthase [Marinobacterium sp.]